MYLHHNAGRSRKHRRKIKLRKRNKRQQRTMKIFLNSQASVPVVNS